MAAKPLFPQFTALHRLRVPHVTRAIGVMVTIGIAASVLVMIYVPWLQTSQGTGKVIALDPRDRVTSITALVPGRIDHWYVTDGQLVKKGDPIAKIIDNDPQLLPRLQAQREQTLAEIASVEQALATAELDVKRTSTLYREGLAARRDYELALIKVADYKAKLASERASLTTVEINLNRQDVQLVRAPRAGRILNVNAGDQATLVKAGDPLATIAPENSERVVELYIDGRDVPLIYPGRRARLEFEGWPAIQASGWPSVAVGVFDGRVRSIDPQASANGLFRVIIEQAPDRKPWPKEPFVRLGAKVSGWVLMNQVSVGYEIWRQLNDFPLQWDRPGDPKAKALPPEPDNGTAPAK